jgi:hypothetical protein
MTDEIVDYLRGVVGVVEANGYETLCLWQENHEQRGMRWNEARSGYGETVGMLAGMPVCLSLLVHEIDGHRLLFIDPTSQVVDHRAIEAWLREHLPASAHREYGGINKVDAMNFHNVFPRKRAA